MKKVFYVLLLLLSVILGPTSVFAVDRTWDGGGDPDFNWNTAANWDGAAPIAGDALFFAGATGLSNTNNILTGTSFAGITFNAGAGSFVLGGNDITLSGNVTNSSTDLQTINLNMSMLATRTFDAEIGGITIGSGAPGVGVLSGAGGVIKEGSGTLTLAGANTYTGKTEISEGTLSISDETNLGSNPGAFAADQLTLNGGTLQTTADITIDDSNRGITIESSGGTFNVDDTKTLLLGSSNIITGSGTITKEGDGMLITGAANTYTGLTLINNGTFKIENGSGLGTTDSGTTVANWATLMTGGDITIAENITLNGSGHAGGGALRSLGGYPIFNGSITLASASRINSDADVLDIRGQISASVAGTGFTVGGAGQTYIRSDIANSVGSLTKDGANYLFLLGTGNAYSGATNIDEGTLALGDSGVIPDSSAVTVTGTLDMNSYSETIGSLAGGGTVTSGLAGAVTLITGGNGASTIFSGGIGDGLGVLSLTKTGSGTLTLSGVNTYTGKTTVTGGTLSISAATGIGADPGAYTADQLTLDGGTLSNTAVIDLGNRGITLGASGGTINTDVGLTLGGTTNGIAGSGSMTKTGGGNLGIGPSSYTGATIVSGGTLTLFGADAIASSSSVTVNGTLNYHGYSNTLNVLSGSGTITSDTGSATLTVDTDNYATEFSGVIEDGMGLTTLSVIGNGTLTLSGVNTYTGTTTVSGGAWLAIEAESGLGANPGVPAAGQLTLDNGRLTALATFTIDDSNRGITLGAGGGEIECVGDLTIANVIAGSGSLTVTGAGVLILTANNTYDGATLNAPSGYLQIGNNGTTGTLGDGAVSNEGNLYFHRSNTMTVSNVISGGGTVQQTGDGTTVLTGTNDYSGNTVVAAGVLEIGNASALGSTAGGTEVHDGASLNLAGYTVTGEALTLNGAGAVPEGALYGSGTWTGTINLATTSNIGSEIAISGIISGAGGINITGAGGTVTLSGENTYEGVTTILDGGNYILVNNAKALGSTASGTVILDDTMLVLGGVTVVGEALTLNGSGFMSEGALNGNGTWTGDVLLATDSQIGPSPGNITISGNISGASNLTIEHPGASGNMLILSGTNTYSGTTTIVNHTLQIGSGGTTGTLGTGDVTNDYALVFNRTNSMTVANAISGSGTLEQAGGGTTALTGNNTYTGKTTISAGTLSINDESRLGANPGVSTADQLTINGGTLQTTIDVAINDSNRGITLGSSGGTFSTDAATTLTVSNVITGSGALTKSGDGGLLLSANNTYTGNTIVSDGTLVLLSEQGLGTNPGVFTADQLTLNGGILQSAASLTIDDSNRGVTLGASGGSLRSSVAGADLTISNVIAGTGSLTILSGVDTVYLTGANTYDGTTTINSGGLLSIGKGGATGTFGDGAVINNGSVNFGRTNDETVSNDISGTGSIVISNAGTTTLTGTNSYSGTTTINGGTLQIGNAGTTGTLGDGAVTNNSALIFNRTNSMTVANAISGTGTLEQAGSGTLALSGANSYSGLTTISAGTLAVSNASALGTGAVTNNATLDVGTIDLSITGAYTQASGSILSLTVDSPTTSGSITTGVAATIDSGSTVAVTVGTTTYIPVSTRFTIIDTTGAGISDLPGTITSTNPRLRFTAENSSNNLVLVVDRSSGGFASAASNANTRAVGAVLDNIANPSSDMTTLLNTMEGLSNSQVNSAMNTMLPDYSGASIQVTQASLDQLTEAILSHQAYLRNAPLGVSTGSDMLNGVDLWAQGFGSYLHQDKRQLSQGYNASIWGTALGFDIPSLTDLRVGTCFGFTQDYIRGKDSTNRNNINSYQWTVYGEYAKDAYYIDLSGAFALNTYDASRKIYISPSIARTASADYNGQQYQVYVEAGYAFNCKRDLNLNLNLNLTPLASFQYEHLYLDKYTESGADSLNLTVKAQNYDLAQTGFGIKLDYPIDTKYGRLVPELRVKWLYDWIGDAQEVSSSFQGGGGSFATNGFTPAQSTWDFGTKLTMFTNNNWTIAANYDFELKENFYGHYGYANAKYSY